MLDLVIFTMVFATSIIVFVILFILLLFIDGMRLLGVGVIGFGRIHLFTRTSGLGLIWFPLPLFFSVSRVFHLAVLVFYLILLGLMRNSERPGFPIFCRSGQREARLEEIR